MEETERKEQTARELDEVELTLSASPSDVAPRRSTFAKADLSVPNIRLDREIGAGGMGSVWFGEHLTLRAPVAVKFLRPSLVRHPVAIARFQREATAAARLRSSNVVQVFDHGVTAQGIPFIVMEWLEGISLQDRWDDLGRIPVEETIEIVRQTARALAKAHSMGIVHRDIKPDNVFLIGDGDVMTVKVLDFGIAKVAEGDEEDGRVTAAGLVVGTPHFMSPEQMVGAADVGPAADVWALGVLAYACLTGRLPYRGSNVASLALAMERMTPEPVRQLVAEVPEAFDHWIGKALMLDAKHRFADGRTALEALDRALGRSTFTLGAHSSARIATSDLAAPSSDPRASDARPIGSTPNTPAHEGYVVRRADVAKRRTRWLLVPFAMLAGGVVFSAFLPALTRPERAIARGGAAGIAAQVAGDAAATVHRDVPASAAAAPADLARLAGPPARLSASAQGAAGAPSATDVHRRAASSASAPTASSAWPHRRDLGF